MTNLRRNYIAIPDLSPPHVNNPQVHQNTGFHRSTKFSYIDASGTAGVDNTAQAVKTVVLPAFSLKQLGDRLRIRCYWTGDTGTPITCTLAVNGVTVSAVTDGGGATLFLSETWVHFLDSTHAHIVENGAGSTVGASSAINAAGFNWNASQNIEASQNQIANNHIIVYTFVIDIMPKGG